jgi:hypothetical protein
LRYTFYVDGICRYIISTFFRYIFLCFCLYKLQNIIFSESEQYRYIVRMYSLEYFVGALRVLKALSLDLFVHCINISKSFFRTNMAYEGNIFLVHRYSKKLLTLILNSFRQTRKTVTVAYYYILTELRCFFIIIKCIILLFTYVMKFVSKSKT